MAAPGRIADDDADGPVVASAPCPDAVRVGILPSLPYRTPGAEAAFRSVLLLRGLPARPLTGGRARVLHARTPGPQA